ncbi:hypothetical protein SEA_BOLT007_70 [Arthrobacter phage Bolt007]|uniref:Uncharacterized protein n=1 Tax=Arthrobacter phage Bolt007 TaxID=3017297 RepID=A0AA49E4G4_9CAUD|nr:hypothetical protein SEA_BOLT007_70 [Arthrobacter phage Bolt007]
MSSDPSREDLYEAAVRAVLDLCDEAAELDEIAISPERVRRAIGRALSGAGPAAVEEACS